VFVGLVGEFLLLGGGLLIWVRLVGIWLIRILWNGSLLVRSLLKRVLLIWARLVWV
jgi:hypothetical protein